MAEGERNGKMREGKYSIFAVIGKSNRDLRRALLKELGADGSRNLATLDAKLDAIAGRLARIEGALSRARKKRAGA